LNLLEKCQKSKTDHFRFVPLPIIYKRVHWFIARGCSG
jgi:hypothetical protein